MKLVFIISSDPRHHGVAILLRQEVVMREFAEWSMAFRDLGDPDVAKIPGFSVFLNSSSENPYRYEPLL